jgi:mono/diheme cytochrome c family protein
VRLGGAVTAPAQLRILSPVKTAVVALLVIVVGLTAGAAVLLLRGGLSARVEPTSIETAVARPLRRLLIDSSARSLRNPLPRSVEVVHAGRAHFADHCALCHANDGSGETEIGRNLYPRTPDLRSADTQSLTDGELLYIIEQGVRFTGMPAWGDGSEDSRRASWSLVHFIRHLPALGPQERLEMEPLNPKSREQLEEEESEERFLEGDRAPAKKQTDGGHRH